MNWFTADLVISVEQGLGEQVADVATPQAIHHSSSITPTLDQAGKAELREVLARNGRAASSSLGQSGHVGFACP